MNAYEREFAALHGKDMSLKQADQFQRQIDSAHRRYLSALKTLAVVRRLALPTIMVNMAEGRERETAAREVSCEVAAPPSIEFG